SRRAFFVMDALSRAGSAQRCAPAADPHVRAFADSGQVGLLHGAQVAVLHAHGDAVGGAFLDPVLDRVAGDRAANRAGRGGDVLVALAAAGLVGNLVAGHRADDAAQDRAGGVGDVLAAGDGLDARHRPALAADAAAVGRCGAVAAAVAWRSRAARGGQCGGQGGGAKQSNVHAYLLSLWTEPVAPRRNIRRGAVNRWSTAPHCTRAAWRLSVRVHFRAR